MIHYRRTDTTGDRMRRALAGLAVGVLLLPGCGGGDSGEDAEQASASPSTLPPTTATETSSEAPPAPTEPPQSPRGNYLAAVGEESRVTLDGVPIIYFTIDSITPDVPCTGDYVQPAENGHFVALQMRVATTTDLPAEVYWSVSPDDFAFVRPDGVTVDNVLTTATFSCIDTGLLFTNDILSPASQYLGTIMLDLPATTGTLIYRPSPAGGALGWEWTF